MSLEIQEKWIERISKISLSIVNDYLVATQVMEVKTLLSFGFLLDRLRPEESKAALRRLLLRRAEAIESEIIDYYMKEYGWVYGELSIFSNTKIMALLKVGHEFGGSYSEALYNSLHSYVDRFKVDGGAFRNPWDLCHYLDTLLNLSDNGINGYEKEIRDCAKMLMKGLETITVSDQLKSYIIWLAHRVFLKGIFKFKSINFEKLAAKMASRINNIPLEGGLWIMSNCIDIGAANSKMTKVLEDFLTRLSSEDLWEESARASFLVFASSILRMTNSYLEIPYAAVSSKETPFFGMVSETLLKGALDLEKEKKTRKFDENSLRNRFLAILRARFDGLATSETFRCKGLTDIIVINPKNHYEELVIECKIWKGTKYYHGAIDQAMSYLTTSEERVIILVFFKDAEGLLDIRGKLVKAVESKQGFEGLSEGIISLDNPVYFPSGNRYLFSWQKKAHRKVGIHHIFVNLELASAT